MAFGKAQFYNEPSIDGVSRFRIAAVERHDPRCDCETEASTAGLAVNLSSVVVVNHREIPAGLLVDEVLGFRRFAEGEFSGDAPPTVARCERYLAGAFRRAHEQWPVLSLRSVLESPAFAEAAA